MSKRTDKYLVQSLREPAYMATPEFQSRYAKFARRILWVDNNVVPGAFQMNTAWYNRVPEFDPVFPEHAHDQDELIGFISCDPERPYDLGAEIVVHIDGEEHVLTQSTMIFIPGGLPHMPLSIRKVDRPVFHFSVLMGKEYTGGAYE